MAGRRPFSGHVHASTVISLRNSPEKWTELLVVQDLSTQGLQVSGELAARYYISTTLFACPPKHWAWIALSPNHVRTNWPEAVGLSTFHVSQFVPRRTPIVHTRTSGHGRHDSWRQEKTPGLLSDFMLSGKRCSDSDSVRRHSILLSIRGPTKLTGLKRRQISWKSDAQTPHQPPGHHLK